MFGKHFGPILALTALAWMAYTLPSVRDAIASAQAYDSSGEAATFISFEHRLPVSFGSSSPTIIGSSIMRDNQRGINPPQNASSTQPRPVANDRRLSPEEVISILVKQGIIPSDKISQARQVIASYTLNTPPDSTGSYPIYVGEHEASSTFGTSTRMRPRFPLPPMPPMPGQLASSTPHSP
jgi:hypothetical protein